MGDEIGKLTKNGHYSKAFIIRPGHSRLLEFEKKRHSTGCLIETFSK